MTHTSTRNTTWTRVEITYMHAMQYVRLLRTHTRDKLRQARTHDACMINSSIYFLFLNLIPHSIKPSSVEFTLKPTLLFAPQYFAYIHSPTKSHTSVNSKSFVWLVTKEKITLTSGELMIKSYGLFFPCSLFLLER